MFVSSEGGLWSLGLEGFVMIFQFFYQVFDIVKYSILKFRGERLVFIYSFINLSIDYVLGLGLGFGGIVVNIVGIGFVLGSSQFIGDIVYKLRVLTFLEIFVLVLKVR